MAVQQHAERCCCAVVSVSGTQLGTRVGMTQLHFVGGGGSKPHTASMQRLCLHAMISKELFAGGVLGCTWCLVLVWWSLHWVLPAVL
jgi:hypothetical protein